MSANPLSEGLSGRGTPAPCLLVIFGASGDLTQRKLVPALYSLHREGQLPHPFKVVGIGRTSFSDKAFREHLKAGAKAHARAGYDSTSWKAFEKDLSYVTGASDDDDTYLALEKRLDDLEAACGLPGNRLFYLATPPASFTPIADLLARNGFTHPVTAEGPYSRLIVEKPFGKTLASAHDLNEALRLGWDEAQIYRIDHYLGKETVQNVMALRFANGIFEPLWNAKHIAHVQITVAEAVGVGERGGYYDGAGALRDMVQNHLMQLLALTAMEPPTKAKANAIRNEKVKVLEALRPVRADQLDFHMVRAQYTEGHVDGQGVKGYLQETGVPKASQTETYVALRAFVDNWRWAGVPFYLRTGKRLPKRVSEIAVTFKSAPLPLFEGAEEGNALVIRVQPDEGVSLKVGSKVPGEGMRVTPVQLEFRYGTSFGAEPPEAYERLLLDAMWGDATLFTRADEVEASWRWCTPLLEGIAEGRSGVEAYEAGTWGPQEAARLLIPDGHRWRRL